MPECGVLRDASSPRGHSWLLPMDRESANGHGAGALPSEQAHAVKFL